MLSRIAPVQVTAYTATTALGAQIALLVNVLDPAAVILGGGLGLSEGLYRQGLMAALRRHIWSPSRRALPVISAATGADAGWMGAAAHAANCFFSASKTSNTNSIP